MPTEIRSALAMFCIALTEATELATGRPIGALSGHLMREMAQGAAPETAELCAFLSDCADPPSRKRFEVIEGGAA